MPYVIWMVVLTVIAALLFTAKRNLAEIRDDRQSKIHYLASLLRPGGFLILGLMAFITFFASVHQVPAGHIGVVYEFGGIKGQIAEGLQFVAPWHNVMLANIQVQRRVFDKLNAFSEESQDASGQHRLQPGVQKAIEDKQIATQRALEEEQKIEGEKHKAQQAIERAKGEGSAILFRAEKEVEANRKLAASLTPDLVRYAMVEKLSDKIQVMLLPAGQNFILDSEILRGAPKDLFVKRYTTRTP